MTSPNASASGWREYWIGSVFVVEWKLVDVDGAPVTTAVVTGTIATPSGGTAAMTIDHEAGTNVYRGSFTAAAAGRHGWRLQADSGGDGAIGGSFTVSADVTGAEPITKDLTTPVGRIRLLITDVDDAFPLLTDAEITALLGIEGGNEKRGAAACLETIATSETLVTKKITTQDLSTDGPAVAEDLRKRAKLLRDQADKEAPAGADVDAQFGFDFVDNCRDTIWLG